MIGLYSDCYAVFIILPYTAILFSLLMGWWSSLRWFRGGRDTVRRVRKWAEIGGWLKERVVWSVWADLPVPVVVFLH